MTDTPRIAVVLPRNMTFGPVGATSIDLCAHDLVSFSRYRDTTTIVAEELDTPFEGFDLRLYPRKDRRRRNAILRDLQPDLIVVHQHVPTAAQMRRRFPNVPLVVHRHNFLNPPKERLSRWNHLRRLSHVDALAFVSEACARKFELDWPSADCLVRAVPNGLDISAWHPVDVAHRDKTILYAGRVDENKGITLLARALFPILEANPDWSADLFLVDAASAPDLMHDIDKLAATFPDQCRIHHGAGHSNVRDALCRAAIAVVPTVKSEAFGRAALEAMAGGAALISSRIGGLDEVIGDAAIGLDVVNTASITTALDSLMHSSERRHALYAKGLARAAENFDIRMSAARMDQIYEAFL
jgi:glycosyltransferase involved in cell wall biosynthesis